MRPRTDHDLQLSVTAQTKRYSYQQWKQELGSWQATTAPPKDREGVWPSRQVSAQVLAIALRSAMSQASTACTFWKNEVVSLTKEVAEQSTEKEAGENSMVYSSVPVPPAGMDSSQPLTSTDNVDSPLQTSRFAEGNSWEHIPSTSAAVSDTRSVAYESSSNRKEAEKFVFGPWPRASTFGSVAILAQEPFPVRTCTVFFPFTSASGFALSKCLQPSFVVSHLFSWHVRVMERMCLFLPYLPPHRIWVLRTLKEQDTVPVRWRRKSTECSYKLRSCRFWYRAFPGSKIASKRFPRQWPRTMRKSRILKKWLAALQPVLPHWKRMRRPSPVDPARQDLGIYSDIAMVPQPLGLWGPMAQGHLMTIEIQDEDLIHSQAPKMSNHELPFYYDSPASNTTKG